MIRQTTVFPVLIISLFLVASFALKGFCADNRAESLAAKLDVLQKRISTLEYTETVRIENKRRDGSNEVIKREVHVRYGRSAGKMRRDLVYQDPPRKKRDLTGITAMSAAELKEPQYQLWSVERPDPAWLFRLADEMRRALTRSRDEGKGILVEIRQRGQFRPGPARTVWFNVDQLPEIFMDYGADGKPMVVKTIRWQRTGTLSFPAEITIVQESLENTVTTSITYTSVKVNGSLPASSFESE